jgi:molecular chaperone GrpE
VSDQETATPAANQAATDGQRPDTAKQAQSEQQAAPSVEELSQSLQEWQAKADGYLNELLRTRAEAENVRKRAQRDVENAHKYGQDRLVSEMLPVKDSMELGLSAAETATDVTSIREGLELTLKMFNTALEKIGVTEVNPVGEKFNPELHQAMSMQEADAEPGSVLTVVQKGYQLNDRLVRPAMVIVAKAKN